MWCYNIVIFTRKYLKISDEDWKNDMELFLDYNYPEYCPLAGMVGLIWECLSLVIFMVSVH